MTRYHLLSLLHHYIYGLSFIFYLIPSAHKEMVLDLKMPKYFWKKGGGLAMDYDGETQEPLQGLVQHKSNASKCNSRMSS